MRTKLLLLAISVAMTAGCARLPPTPVPVPPQPHALAVIFDIDGTLTPGVFAVSEVRPDAAKAVRRYFDKGYKVIYLSTRLSLLQHEIPGWLKENGFPESNIHVAQTEADHQNEADFKSRILKDYVAKGWKLAVGYGDSSTDFKAYADAGIQKSNVFGLIRRGATKCQDGPMQDCLDGWTGHLTYIDSRND